MDYSPLQAASIPGNPSVAGDRTGVSGLEDRSAGDVGTNVHMALGAFFFCSIIGSGFFILQTTLPTT